MPRRLDLNEMDVDMSEIYKTGNIGSNPIGHPKKQRGLSIMVMRRFFVVKISLVEICVDRS